MKMEFLIMPPHLGGSWWPQIPPEMSAHNIQIVSSINSYGIHRMFQIGNYIFYIPMEEIVFKFYD